MKVKELLSHHWNETLAQLYRLLERAATDSLESISAEQDLGGHSDLLGMSELGMKWKLDLGDLEYPTGDFNSL